MTVRRSNQGILMTRARRPLELLLASLLIVSGGAYLGVVLKLVLTGGDLPATQVALMAIGGTLALIAGVLLLRRATRHRDTSPTPDAGPTAVS